MLNSVSPKKQWMISHFWGKARKIHTKEGMGDFDLPTFCGKEKDIFQSVARYVESGSNNEQADPDHVSTSRQVATLLIPIRQQTEDDYGVEQASCRKS